MTEKRLLSIREFTEQYGPSRAKVYLLLKSGVLAAKKVGKSTYITAEEAERWRNELPAYESVTGVSMRGE